MFKKRLKGLLAMVLAGSIALSALPMSASAKLMDGYVTIKGGDLNNSTVSVSDIGQTSFTGGVLHDNTKYLNDNNMWAFTAYDNASSGQINATVSGDNLANHLYGYKDSNDFLSDAYIKYSHKYVVTTDDPTATNISTDNAQTATTFPVTIDSPDPKKSITGYTVWYGVPNDGSIGAGSAVKAGTTLSEPVDSISIPMSAFAGLYTTYIPNCYYDKTFQDGVTLIQVDTEYKPLDIPVLNALGKPEMDGGNPYTITVTRGSDDYYLKGNQDYFYVGYTNKDGKVVLSNNYMNTHNSAWTEIDAFAANDPNFDANKLFFLRRLYVGVYKDSSDIGSFTSRDLLLAANDGKKPAAYEYLEAADPHSIWRGTQHYILGNDLLKDLETCLDNYPGREEISLTEATEIVVTGTEPVKGNSAKPYATSPLFVEDTDPEQTVPATISDHAAVLAKSVAPEAGNNYDTSNWQLWGCLFAYGDVMFWQKSTLESTNGVDSIGINELNTTVTAGPVPLIYFPQTQIAPSLEVTAPVAGETPSFDCTIKDKVGGYSVQSVVWLCDGFEVTENDKFKAGKEYTVVINLQPDEGLSFTSDTPVTINGEEAYTEYSIDVGLYAMYMFPALPAAAPGKPVNVKATAGDGKVDLSWEDGEGAYGYNVYLYNEDGTLTEIARTQNNSCTIENLANGTEYGFLIRAVSEAGVESSYTAEDVVYATPVAPPSKPANVKAAAGDGQVTVTWDAVPGATNYAVFSYVGGKYTSQGNTTATTMTVKGLTNNTKYGFLVRACVNGTWTSFTAADLVYATPVSSKPVVTATAGNGQVTVTWNAVPGATNYAVFSYVGGKYTSQGNTTATTMTVKGLTNNTKYGFLVRACVNGVWSSFTAADLVYATPVGSSKPVVTATPGDGQVTLSWTAPAGATKYAVFSYVNGTYTSQGNTTATTMTVKGLANNTKYGFLVRAYVNGAWTSFTTADLVYATPVGSAKPVVTATPGDGQVTLSWTAPAGATKYAVFSYIDGKYTSQGNTTATKLTVKGLTNNTKYGFLVRAYVNGAWTSFTTADLVYATPVGSSKPVVTATAGDGQVTLSWTAPAGATKYAVFSYIDGKYTSQGYTTATTLTVKGLTNNTKYGFLVRAYVDGAWTSFTTADLVYATPKLS